MTDVNAEQPLKRAYSIMVTPSGIVIVVRLVHNSKARVPMVVMVFGSVICVRLAQFMKPELVIAVKLAVLASTEMRFVLVIVLFWAAAFNT